MKVNKFLIPMVAFLSFMFLMNLEMNAQTEINNQNLLSQKQLSTADLDFVDDDNAISILYNTSKSFDFNNNSTPVEELELNVLTEYYSYLITELSQGNGLAATLENSGSALMRIMSKFKSNSNLTAMDIYNVTLNLLEQ